MNHKAGSRSKGYYTLFLLAFTVGLLSAACAPAGQQARDSTEPLATVVNAAPVTPSPTPVPTNTPVPPPTATLSPDMLYVEAIYKKMGTDDTIPEVGRDAEIALFIGQPTYLYPKDDAIVLQFNIDEVPDYEMADKAAIMLSGTALVEATIQQFPVAVIEVIYYDEAGDPYFGWLRLYPWGAENIYYAPMNEDLLEQYGTDNPAFVTPESPFPTETPDYDAS